MCWGGPFPLFAIAYAFIGFGFGIAVSGAPKPWTESLKYRMPKSMPSPPDYHPLIESYSSFKHVSESALSSPP